MTTAMDPTFAERYERAKEVMQRFFAGKLDPDYVIERTEHQFGAMGSYGIYFAMGDVWSRPGLSRRDRSLIILPIIAIIAREEEFRLHVRAGMNHGLSREEILEIILHMGVYAGFPRGIRATALANEVFRALDGGRPLPPLPPAEKKSLDQRRRDGKDVYRTLSGRTDVDQAAVDMEKHLGLVGQMGIDFLFGELWARPQLSRRDRSLITCSVLAALGRTDQLKFHIPGALNHGVTPVELEELCMMMSVYGGWPAGVAAMLILKETLAKRAEKAEKK